MKKIQKLLEESISQEQALRGARAWRALRRWEEVVGTALADRSAPDRYDDGTVWVAVMGSAWANELRMQKGTILHRLREISGEPSLFSSLRFGVRKFDRATVMVMETESEDFREERSAESIREIGERLIKKLQDEGRT